MAWREADDVVTDMVRRQECAGGRSGVSQNLIIAITALLAPPRLLVRRSGVANGLKDERREGHRAAISLPRALGGAVSPDAFTAAVTAGCASIWRL
jgi:hypothetical protein